MWAKKGMCIICFGVDLPVSCIECENGHNICSDCTCTYGDNLLKSRRGMIEMVPCPICKIPLHWKHLAVVLDTKRFSMLIDHYYKQDQEKEKIVTEVSKKEDVIVSLKRGIRICLEDFDIPKRPCCGLALLDFDGCFSLFCEVCDCHFCAWCMDSLQTSQECHEHVRFCSHNPEQGNVFGNISDLKEHWKNVQKEKKLKKLKYIQTEMHAFLQSCWNSESQSC